MYNSREKRNVLTPYKSFMLKAQTALAKGHFSNQLRFWGAVVRQYKQGCAIQIRHVDLR